MAATVTSKRHATRRKALCDGPSYSPKKLPLLIKKKRKPDQLQIQYVSTIIQEHIYTNIKGLTFLFYFFIQKKKNSRVSQDSPQVKKKIRKTEAERQIDRGLKLSVRFLVISQKAYLKNVQITNSRPRSRKSYNYAN